MNRRTYGGTEMHCNIFLGVKFYLSTWNIPNIPEIYINLAYETCLILWIISGFLQTNRHVLNYLYRKCEEFSYWYSKKLTSNDFLSASWQTKNCKNELKNDILTCLVWSKKLFWGHHWGWLSKFNPKMFREPQKVTVAPKRAQDITSWQLELMIFKIFRILKISLRWVFSIVKIPQI